MNPLNTMMLSLSIENRRNGAELRNGADRTRQAYTKT